MLLATHVHALQRQLLSQAPPHLDQKCFGFQLNFQGCAYSGAASLSSTRFTSMPRFTSGRMVAKDPPLASK
jgi:hypothetical protein